MTGKFDKFVLAMTIVLLVTGIFQFNIVDADEIPSYKMSNDQTTLADPQGPIRIYNDSRFENVSADQGWAGNGTSDNPYIIDGFTIDAGGASTGVHIGNTTSYFILKNCNIFNTSDDSGGWYGASGITLYQVTNGVLKNNNCSGHVNGIRLRSSTDCIVDSNLLRGNSEHGILLEYSDHNRIKENQLLENGYLTIHDSENNRLYGNEMEDSYIDIDGGENTYTTQIITTNNTVNGGPVYYYKNNKMDNTSVSSDAGQVILANVTYVNVENSHFKNICIYIGYSHDITIHDNEFINEGLTGIRVKSSTNINIKENNFDKIGIEFLSTESSSINNNTFKAQAKGMGGIILEDNNFDNKIDNNTLERCSIDVYDSHGTTIVHNLIYKSIGEGIIVHSSSTDNRIIYNALLYNKQSRDELNDTRIQARDDGQDNYWNTSEKGNFWRDRTAPDDDGDGIVDKTYPIAGGNSFDFYPLVEPMIPVLATPPRNLSVKPGNAFLNLSWIPPSNDGGSELTAYNIYRGNQSTDMKLLDSVESTHSFYRDETVQNGVEYHYKVSVLNGVGESLSSSIKSGVPDGQPPQLIIHTPKNGTFFNASLVQVKFSANDTNSGLDRVSLSLDQGGWMPLNGTDNYTFTNLTEGKHTISLRAFDKAANNITKRIKIFIDTTKPHVLSYGPTHDLAPRDTLIWVNFSEPMSTVELLLDGEPTNDTYWTNDTSLIYGPSNLTYGESYEVIVNGRDRADNPVTQLNWTFKVTDMGYIKGRILNDEDEPIQGVNVSLDTGQYDTTNSSGYFMIKARRGTYELKMSKTGYEDKKIKVIVEPGETVDLGNKKITPASSQYDWMLIIFTFAVVSAGIAALTMFVIREREEEEVEFDEEELFGDETEELPPEFLEDEQV
ncbi:MAG: NosD domain-containing protein [Thermoplasmata archaeon]